MNPEYFANADIGMLKAYSYATVNEAFDYIANTSRIEFRFPQGGCQQRAHMMSVILNRKFHIEHCKVWLFSPAALRLFECNTLFIKDPNGLTENNRIEWNYHVVPVIRVNTGNAIELVVTDPSLNKEKPILLSEWFSHIGNSSISKYSFLLPDKYFFNTSYTDNMQTLVFDGSFFDFDEFAKNDLTMEKGMALNDMVMKIYKRHIQPLLTPNKTNDAKKTEDLKAIFGNATAIDLLFSQNISGNSENTALRYVETQYPEIIQEARQLFYERLTFWTGFTNELFNQ